MSSLLELALYKSLIYYYYINILLNFVFLHTNQIICCVFCRNDRIAGAFDRLDKDGNGVLSPAEVSVVIKEQLGFDDNMTQWLVQMFDQNKDGSLDKTEFMDMWTSMFG